jgi:hypothetical protein
MAAVHVAADAYKSMAGRFIKHLKRAIAHSQGTATTYRVARLLRVPRPQAVWIAAVYLVIGRTINYKIQDKHWRVTP